MRSSPFRWMELLVGWSRPASRFSREMLPVGGSRNSMLLIISSSWIVGGAVYALFREKRFRITWEKARFILLSSFLVIGIVNFLMLAVQHGDASTVIPIANMSFVIALLLSVALKMEILTAKKIGAMAFAITSILLLAQS